MAEVQIPQSADTPAAKPAIMQRLAEIIDKLAPQLVQGMTPKYGTTVTASSDAATPGMIGAPITGGQPPASSVPSTPGGVGIMPPNVGGQAQAVIQQQHGLSPNPSVPIPLPHSSGFSFPDSRTAKAATVHDAITNITGVVNAVKQRQEQKLERRATIIFNSLHDAITRGDNETIGKMLDPETPEGKTNMKILEKAGIGVPPEIDMKKQKPSTPEQKAMEKALGAKVNLGKPGISANPDPAVLAAQKAATDKAESEAAANQAYADAQKTKAGEKSLSDYQQRLIELSRQDPSKMSPEDARELEVLKQLHNVTQAPRSLTAPQQRLIEWNQNPKPGYPSGQLGLDQWQTDMKAKLKDKSPVQMVLDATAKELGVSKSDLTAEQIEKITTGYDVKKQKALEPVRLAHDTTVASIREGVEGRLIDKRAAVSMTTSLGKQYGNDIEKATQAKALLDGYLKQMDAGAKVDLGQLKTKLGDISVGFSKDTGIAGALKTLTGSNEISRSDVATTSAVLSDVMTQLKQQQESLGSITKEADPVDKLFNKYGIK